MTKRRKVKVGRDSFVPEMVYEVFHHIHERGLGRVIFISLLFFIQYQITKRAKSKSLWVSEAWSWQKNIAKPEHSGRIWLCHCSRMCRLAIFQRIRVMILSAVPGSWDARHFFSENEFHAKTAENDSQWRNILQTWQKKARKWRNFSRFPRHRMTGT